MRFPSLDWPQGQPMLIRIFAILGLLLIALAVVALLSDVLSLLDRFRPEIYLFLLGALLAYLMAPIVRLFHRLLRVHVAAVLASYLLLFAAVLMFGALLLTPFVSQAQSLVKNMQSPSASTLARLHLVESDLFRTQAALHTQQRVLNSGRPIPADQVRQVQSNTANVVAAVI